MTKRVIQTDDLASSTAPITKSKEACADIPQSYRPLGEVQEHTFLAREESTMSILPQGANALANSTTSRVSTNKIDTQQILDLIV